MSDPSGCYRASVAGCRGPAELGYQPSVDGDPNAVGFSALAGQPFSLAGLGAAAFPNLPTVGPNPVLFPTGHPFT
ncbi:MAG: hypothetical protein MJE66_14205, partial [Proteobacteria bacterium]|nr:hypothetical protein [Pseudomonadota bacterium]